MEKITCKISELAQAFVKKKKGSHLKVNTESARSRTKIYNSTTFRFVKYI